MRVSGLEAECRHFDYLNACDNAKKGVFSPFISPFALLFLAFISNCLKGVGEQMLPMLWISTCQILIVDNVYSAANEGLRTYTNWLRYTFWRNYSILTSPWPGGRFCNIYTFFRIEITRVFTANLHDERRGWGKNKTTSSNCTAAVL